MDPNLTLLIWIPSVMNMNLARLTYKAIVNLWNLTTMILDYLKEKSRAVRLLSQLVSGRRPGARVQEPRALQRAVPRRASGEGGCGNWNGERSGRRRAAASRPTGPPRSFVVASYAPVGTPLARASWRSMQPSGRQRRHKWFTLVVSSCHSDVTVRDVV